MNLSDMTDNDIHARIAELELEASRYKNKQLTFKTLLVCAYGTLGTEYSRYFDVRIAESITISGQLSIRWVARKINEYLNTTLGTENKSFLVGGDTDSIYITLNAIVKKYLGDKPTEKIVRSLDLYCEKKIQPIINAAYNELGEQMNVYHQRMRMSREVIAERGLWRAKKNYILSVWNSEGIQYTTPDLKIMGIECVKSSTPEMCRVAIKETIRLMMTSDEVTTQKYIKQFRGEFYSAPIEDISKNIGVSSINDDMTEEPSGFDFSSSFLIRFKPKTSYHVKGSIVYNRMLIQKNLTQKYKTIISGTKVRLIYLKKENPTKNNLIAYPDILPPEFKLAECIDRDVQFEKNYISPMKSLLDLAGWSVKKQSTLF